MGVPALKEIKGSEAAPDQALWGWWDGLCQVWHVMPRPSAIKAVKVEPTPSGAVWVELTTVPKSDWAFDEKSRLLVAE